MTLRSGVMDDQLNVPLEDSELLAEVELTTNLIIAATESEQSLPQTVIDELLGVDEEPDAPPAQHFDAIPAQARHSA